MAAIKISRVRFAAALAGGVLVGALAAGTAFAVQRHMLNARADLYAANRQLQMALPDKGGHRVSAMNLVEQAISEVNAGISAGAE